MTQNYVEPGHVISVILPDDVLSGQGVLHRSLFGVATKMAIAYEPVELAVEGVFDLRKRPEKIMLGMLLYWDQDHHAVTSKVSDKCPVIGVAVSEASGTAWSVRVRLNGAFVQ